MNSFRIEAHTNESASENPWLKTLQPDHGFNSQSEFIEAVSDPRYDAPGLPGQHFREYVAALLKQSDFGDGSSDLTSNEAKASARQAQALLDEDLQILREHAFALFNNPLYETSALYRRQVREQIAANPHLADMIVPPGPSVRECRLEATEADYNDIKKMLADEKKAAHEQSRKAAIEQATRDAERKYVDITGMDAGDTE